QRGAGVCGGGGEHLGEVFAVRVDGAGQEGGFGAQGEGEGVEGGVEGTQRRGLGDLALFGGGRVLALGQPVDAVVEQQDLQVHVAAQRVDQVVAADGQCVAVAGDHPHAQVGAGGGQAGGDGGGASVDGVHPVGVHVVGEAAGAADPGDEHDVLPRDTQGGHQALDRGQDRVVTTPRTPTHLLIRLEILDCQRECGARGRNRCVAVLGAVRALGAIGRTVGGPVGRAVHTALKHCPTP